MGKKKGPKYDAIIDAAVIVFAQNGYHLSKVSKIAKQAGVADGTIYLYFKNKEDILISMFEEKMSVFVDRIKHEINRVTSIEKKLEIMIEMHFTQLELDPDLAIVTQLELRQSNTNMRYQVNEVLKGYLGLIDAILEEGIRQGVLDPDLNIRIARQIIFGAVDEVATNWVMKERKYALTPLASSISDMLMKGLSMKTQPEAETKG
ncbi:TetR/AcrR family transcriptional regulator [Salisediminibacterium selenitireducens]|uniref:Transcriptional regulator, TetR family n=1 Tax=Bacillus selenitireducens (strain ATCC 700615 / DSM 15326 / MLS10) TaxID=439292 RepID=D6XSW9_BACIE|nr:TetR/AcrR family transcriptional regulator [Salisediminibacterium selenitireducens]ADH98905.1 transcriptional regulator, TetR family [[Bacillus] selenitireducens MLS10]